MSSIRYLS